MVFRNLDISMILNTIFPHSLRFQHHRLFQRAMVFRMLVGLVSSHARLGYGSFVEHVTVKRSQGPGG